MISTIIKHILTFVPQNKASNIIKIKRKFADEYLVYNPINILENDMYKTFTLENFRLLLRNVYINQNDFLRVIVKRNIVSILKKILMRSNIDPSIKNNWAIIFAASKNHLQIGKVNLT